MVASIEKGDLTGVFINGIGLLPVLGMVKNSDELASIYKTASKVGLIRKGKALFKSLLGKIPRKTTLKHIADSNDEVMYLAKIKKIQFDTKLKAVANDVGGKVELTDLKDLTRAGQKSADLREVRDIVRGSITFNNTDSIYAAFPAIKKHYDDIVALEDRLSIPLDNGFEYVTMIVRDKDGFLMEIKFSTHKMFEASKLEHPIYEIRRQITENGIGGASLDDIIKAEETFKRTAPERYERIKGAIEEIKGNVRTFQEELKRVREVTGVTETTTEAAIDAGMDILFQESKRIFSELGK